MQQLNEKLMREIVENSNHKTIESVKNAIYTGDIEIYKNEADYEKAEYDLKHKDLYIILTNGNVVHFVGG